MRASAAAGSATPTVTRGASPPSRAASLVSQPWGTDTTGTSARAARSAATEPPNTDAAAPCGRCWSTTAAQSEAISARTAAGRPVGTEVLTLNAAPDCFSTRCRATRTMDLRGVEVARRLSVPGQHVPRVRHVHEVKVQAGREGPSDRPVQGREARLVANGDKQLISSGTHAQPPPRHTLLVDSRVGRDRLLRAAQLRRRVLPRWSPRSGPLDPDGCEAVRHRPAGMNC